jgi:hypothetical protein
MLFYGLNIDINNPAGNPDPPVLTGLGAGSVRLSYIDRTPGPYPDMATMQRYLEWLGQYLRAGIPALIILHYDTLPGFPGAGSSEQAWEQYVNTFCTRLIHIASHFRTIYPAYQIWNEPDLAVQPDGYAPGIPPHWFGWLLSRAYATLKGVDPEATIVGGGLASGLPDYWAQTVASQPGEVLVDAVAIHPYTKQPVKDWPHEGWGTGWVGDLINAYAQVYPKGDIWITEAGVNLRDVTEQVQAEYLHLMYQTVGSQFKARVPRLYWFCLSSGMVPGWGLLREDSTPTPSYDAYRRVSGAATHTT